MDGKPTGLERVEWKSDWKDEYLKTVYAFASGVGSIATFIKKEVLPYTSDAWVDESQTNIGYEVSSNKRFYRPVKLRELSEIMADIGALKKDRWTIG